MLILCSPGVPRAERGTGPLDQRSARTHRLLSLQLFRDFDYGSWLSPAETPIAHLDELTETLPSSALPGPGRPLEDITQSDPTCILPGPASLLLRQ